MRTIGPWFLVSSLLLAGGPARSSELWSLAPLEPPTVPAIAATDRADNSIDSFVLARLRGAGLALAPEADRRTFLRRLSFDLIGLPPTAAEVEAFVTDTNPLAHERLVDRLLASPHFGERWARYWLDLARFAESNGYERDETKNFAWKYRDWVVRAINDDMPFDRFVLEQLAGDELADSNEATVTATGFLRLGTWNDEPNDAAEYKYERLEDLVHASSTAFIAMTVKCARCHDHKFDPITQLDYYRFATAFWAGFVEPPNHHGGPTREELGFDVLGWTDRGPQAPPLHLLRKGDPRHPETLVEPGYLSMIPALAKPVAPPPANSRTTTRRRQLAEWITHPQNPLTARVVANRLWQRHFGEGLVRTPDNFGSKGDLPTHPELLDDLATEIIKGGWQMKRMHRLLVLSQTYRQASVVPGGEAANDRDPENRLLWRAHRRRLDAEALRDSLLATSGTLNGRIGGPSFFSRVSQEALEGLSKGGASWGVSTPEDQARRSLYLFTKRSLILPLMTVFDFADTTQPCAQRDVTTVAPQALALLNNAFTHEMSAALATRVARESSANRADQVQRAWSLTLQRRPSATELAAALAHMEMQERHFTAARMQGVSNAPAPGSVAVAPARVPGLVLWLDARSGVELDADGRVVTWKDLSGQGHHASQADPARRPVLGGSKSGTSDGKTTVHFDGQRRFLRLAGPVLTSQYNTVIAVVSDQSTDGAHHGILSNWNGAAGNATTSIFLGTTGAVRQARWSDDFTSGPLAEPQQPLLLTALSDTSRVAVFQGRRLAGERTSPLTERQLGGEYVIGQQGNIDGEYWHGDIVELLVFDRALAARELESLWAHLEARHGFATPPPPPLPPSPRRLALESLCHVLFNANEFLHVD